MLTPEIQDRIENIAIELELAEHPIEGIFAIAKDFENADRETLKLYIDCYILYNYELWWDLNNYLSELLSIKEYVDQEFEELWIKLSLDKAYTGVDNFCIFLDTLSYIGSSQEEGSFSQKEYEKFYEAYFWSLRRRELREKCISIEKHLSDEVERMISNLQKYISPSSPDIDVSAFIQNLNNLLKSSHVKVSGDNRTEDFCFQDDWNLDIYRNRTLDICIDDYSHTLHMNKTFQVVFDLIHFLREKQSFWSHIDILRPSEELLTTLQEDKKVYGAKGAYLRFLRNYASFQNTCIERYNREQDVRNVRKIQSEFTNTSTITIENVQGIKDRMDSILKEGEDRKVLTLTLHLLPSIEVSTELYIRWKTWEDINQTLASLYDEASEKFFQESNGEKTQSDNRDKEDFALPENADGLMVRSSAVNSEDNEKTSWAWVYESIWDIQSLDDFKQAVMTIFKSVESQKAKAHRKRYAIEKEFMWLVIMPYMNAGSAEMWYINTSRAWKSHLLDLKDMRWVPSALDKRILPIDFSVSSRFSCFNSLLFQPDMKTRSWFQFYDSWMKEALQFIFAMDTYFRHALQFEFISNKKRIFLVQMRPLNFPKGTIKAIEFPDKECIYEGRAIIPWDIVVNTSDMLMKNSSREATVDKVFGGNFLDEVYAGTFKAVVMFDSFSTMSWHIETVCAERWIICISNSPSKKYQSVDIRDYNKVRIVSDGEIARIYPVVDEKNSEK